MYIFGGINISLIFSSIKVFQILQNPYSMKMNNLLIASFILIFANFLDAQNVGIGTTEPRAKLDVAGDLILKSVELILADGNTLDLDITTQKFNHYKLTGPTSNFQISGILAAEQDRIVTLYNRAGHSLEMYNDYVTADPEKRILTGTGGTFAVYPGGSVTLKYDNVIDKWEITASHYNSLDNFGSSGLPSTAIVISDIEQNTNLQSANYFLLSSVMIPVAAQSPGTFSWLFPPSTTNAPVLRGEHTAVWTDTQMLVWGGYDPNTSTYLNDGKAYQLATNSWQTIPSSGLDSRSYHTAQWSGSEMLIWGGIGEQHTFGNGSRYNPQTNTWSIINNTNAPSSRFNQTSIWTGSEMIIWGGRLAGIIYRTDHKSYNPSTDAWTTVSNSNSPAPRINHTAVWTGSKMIIFGGKLIDGTITNSGGIYDPATDTWSDISTIGAPPNGLSEHTAIWTGTELITFGGKKNGGISENNFYKYNLINNTWSQGSITNKPISTIYHTAIWTGERMIVYGGLDEIAGVYDPASDTWETQNITNNMNFTKHTAIWTGNAMIVAGTDQAQILKKNFSSPQNQIFYLYKKL